MKLLTFAVPCYNSAAYMEDCIASLLVGGEEVEILIVDDGSDKDNTAAIADRLAAEHPTIVRAIHQKNGGHGEAVNTGIKNATGLYFKVVDSDDHVSPKAYMDVLKVLREYSGEMKPLDMLVSNYVYDKVGVKSKHVVEYRKVLPKNRVFGWNEVGHFKKGQYILMHSVIYRTKLLKECGLELPKHTFYVDNIYVFEPMTHVKRMYYIDTNFYMYYIGREDQSVNESIMIKRVDQQIRVNRIMYDYYSQVRNKPYVSGKLSRYMFNYLEIISTISSVLLILDGNKEALGKKRALWKWMRKEDFSLYKKLRFGLLGIAMNLPGHVGRMISKAGYRIAQKLYQFN